MTILQIKKASRGKPCQKHTNSSRKLPPGININGQESGRRVLSRKVAGRRSNEPKLKGVQNCHFLLRILEHNPSIGLVVTQLDDNDNWIFKSSKGAASQFFASKCHYCKPSYQYCKQIHNFHGLQTLRMPL